MSTLCFTNEGPFPGSRDVVWQLEHLEGTQLLADSPISMLHPENAAFAPKHYQVHYLFGAKDADAMSPG